MPDLNVMYSMKNVEDHYVVNSTLVDSRVFRQGIARFIHNAI